MTDVTAHDSTRRSYDAVAAAYAERFNGELAAKPLDRALLGCLLELAGPGAAVADLGCGPGHVAGWLAAQGAAAVGIDLSDGMVAAARQAHPDASFRPGDLLALPAADGEFGALAAFYTIIHLAPGELAGAFAEMRRVLAPGGAALVAFHLGTEVRHSDDWLGAPVDLDFRFLELDTVAALMAAAGLREIARLERDSYPAEVETRRGYLLAAAV